MNHDDKYGKSPCKLVLNTFLLCLDLFFKFSTVVMFGKLNPVLGRNMYDSISSDEDENKYSDEISSDLETELYSQIYFASNNIICSLSERSHVENLGCDEQRLFNNHGILNQSYNCKNIKTAPVSSTPKDSSNDVKRISTSPSNSKTKAKFSSVLSDDDSSSDDSVLSIRSSDAEKGSLVINVKNMQKTVEQDFSDSSSSDSVIVLNELECNRNDSVCAEDNSTSSSEDEMPTPYRSQDIEPRTNSNKDLWHLDPEDYYSPTRKSGQYYKTKMITNCRNCRGIGHIARDCTNKTARKCYLCGDNHASIRCHKRVCGLCFGVGHNRKHCSYKLNSFCCTICQRSGHATDRCPDIWRRYHLTTDVESRIVAVPKRQRKDGLMYCYNCGEEGHLGYECEFPRYGFSLPSSPYVITYKNSKITTSEGFVTPVEVKPKKKLRLNNFASPVLRRNFNKSFTFNFSTPKSNFKKKSRKRVFSTEPDFPRTPQSALAMRFSKRIKAKKKALFRCKLVKQLRKELRVQQC